MQKCKGCDQVVPQERLLMRAIYCSKRCRIDFIAAAKKEAWKRLSKGRTEKKRAELTERYQKEEPKCYCGEGLPYQTWRLGGSFCSPECSSSRKREHLLNLKRGRRAKEWEEIQPKCLSCNAVIDRDLWVNSYQRRKYCSFECKDNSPNPKVYKKKVRAYFGEIETRYAGAASEFFVLADLSLRGWDVYRALSSGSKYDLVVEKDGLILKIEVRSGWRILTDGEIGFSTKSLGEPDIFAVVTDEGKSVDYFAGKNLEKTKFDGLGFPLSKNEG